MRPLLISRPKFQPLLVCLYSGLEKGPIFAASMIRMETQGSLAVSWLSHCPTATAYKRVWKQGKPSNIPPAQLPISSSTQGWRLCIAREFSLLAPAISFWITYCCSRSSCSQGEHLEGRTCKSPVLLYMCVRAGKGRSETGIMGKNKERKKNGCRKSVLGKMKIPGSRMIALYESVTMAS